MSHPDAKGSLELLLRKLLLGEELVNTEFHLYSVKSSSSGRIIKPRILCANNDLLAKSSKYFTDLLSSDIDPFDPSLREITDDNDVPSECRIEDYGYESDSDLEECEDPIFETSETRSRKLISLIPPPFKDAAEIDYNNGEDSSDDESDSDASDAFFMSSEHSSADDQLLERKDVINETSVKESESSNKKAMPSALRLRSSRSRHVLVKDTAFQTWYTLLNYLSTGEVGFLPLRSATSGGRPQARRSSSTTNSLDRPRCSAKSMYRLACKVGLDNLRNQALACIRSNLTEHNILKEISCSLVSRHRPLLEMELDMLYTCIASPPVVAGFPGFVQRIINKELPHGADILLDIHRRFLRELHPLPSISMPLHPSSASPQPPFTEPASVSLTCNSFNPPFDPPPLDLFDPSNPYPVDPPPIDSSLSLNSPHATFGGWGCCTMPAISTVSEMENTCEDNKDEHEIGIGCVIVPKKKRLGAGGGGKMKMKK